jgi:hypothetical protein
MLPEPGVPKVRGLTFRQLSLSIGTHQPSDFFNNVPHPTQAASLIEVFGLKAGRLSRGGGSKRRPYPSRGRGRTEKLSESHACVVCITSREINYDSLQQLRKEKITHRPDAD